jgi:uncharacterized protein (DUF302 family)
MTGDPAVTTYSMAVPFDRAIKEIREALIRNGVSILTELDISTRLRRELGIGFTRCRILLVDSPYLLLEAATLDGSAATLFPLHIAVSDGGACTLIHWINPAIIEGARLPTGALAPLVKLQSLVTRSLERIAMRRDIYQVSSHAR